MNVHRLVALSSSAVIVAACSGGGASAPHAVQSPASTSPTATKHAPNSQITLKFAQNFVRLKPNPKSKAAKVARRSPKFVDPSTFYDLEVSVQNTTPNGATGPSYMAATDVPIVDSQSNAQTIPIYLAPGYDSILVQEVGIFGSSIGSSSGYLLAQGSTTASIGEGESVNPSLVMQLVMTGADIVTDVSTFSNVDGYMATSNNFSTANGGHTPSVCVSNNQSIYFLPVDYFGGSYAYSENPGDVSPQDGGIPLPTITNLTSTGTSTLKANPFGGYTASFDSAQDPIFVSAYFYAAENPQTFGPFYFSTGGVISQVSQNYNYYYANIEESGSPDCTTPS